jgi:hypothetical protein
MDRFGIDKSKKLRDDILYLWRHGYETVLSCAGHNNRPADAVGLRGYPRGALVDESPYVSYILKTGDGTWETGEGAKRGWYADNSNVFQPELFYDQAQYGPIRGRYGPRIPMLTWRQERPLA